MESEPEKEAEIPSHEFLLKEEKKKPKDQNDVKKFTVNLVIEPHRFKRKKRAKNIGDLATFVCINCEALNKSVTAKARRVGPGNSPNDWELISSPELVQHECTTDSLDHLKFQFVETLYEKIQSKC